jgi:FGGY-family pentulose kinase
MRNLVIGVDVGTGSARAGVFSPDGALLGRATRAIDIRHPEPNHAEQDSEQIWTAVCEATRAALVEAGATGAEVVGIGFDATCSLVVRDQWGTPVSIARDGEHRWDTVVWMDHRALEEAEECTRTGHEVLGFVGGVMSPEMELPKLMWLKRHLPDRWARAGLFLDLADFLTWKASGSLARSQCTLTCKWTYLAHENPGWRADFLTMVGLSDLLERGQLPDRATPIGEDLGPLTAESAEALGLTTACRVGAGLIDAHAGALGVMGAIAGTPEVDHHLALIAGTSSCLMALSPNPRPVPGVWGPYFGAVVPGLWLDEGGQSATGALLDHILRLHGAGGEPTGDLHARVCQRIAELRAAEGPDLAPRLHVLPDFHGNRSPLADPHALGVISGLDLDHSFDGLCRLYWRTALGIALGVRHVVDALNAKGHAIDTLRLTGGHVRNPVLMDLYANATGCSVVESATEDAVLLGSAMAAARAAGLHPSLAEAALAMHRGETTRAPDPEARARHDRDYAAFLLMHEQRRALDALVSVSG